MFSNASPPRLISSLTVDALGLGLSLLIVSPCWANTCGDLGLVRDSGEVMQLREAAQEARSVMVYRDADRHVWFVPLRSNASNQEALESKGRTARNRCEWDNVVYLKIDEHDSALHLDSNTDTLSFLDINRVTDVLDEHRAVLAPTAQTLNSAGVNYQLAFNYVNSPSGSQSQPSAYTDLYGNRNGWYFDTTLGWNNGGKIARYESYALKESVETGIFVRLGDSVSSPTALGEALQFGGLSWGTNRDLRPSDFLPVLPTLRNGNSLSGPVEVFINDTLQFQQTLQNGVYDLRNLPAQQGFNSYSVRTLDAQGNPVTVQREIYLAASLLPAGISSWQIDTGFQREDFFNANDHYGPPLVAGSYARGIDENVTLGARALVSRAASTGAAEYDQRLSDLWTGHLGWLAARNQLQQGQALQARIDGGGKWWRLLVDWTQSGSPLPGLGDRSALINQKLVRAQWNGIPGWNLGLTTAQSLHEFETREDILNLMASTRVLDNGASLLLGWTRSQSANVAQNSLTVSLFLPLAPSTKSTPSASSTQRSDQRNLSLYLSQSNVDGAQLTRAQYASSSQLQRDSSWLVGATRDSRPALSSVDASWTGTTDKLELLASGRSSLHDNSAQLSLRSGVVWTGGSVFLTRPINGAFALVSTDQEGVDVSYENRPVGRTDGQGFLLVPDLRPFEVNQLSLDPANWPIQWTSLDLKREVVPPRGGGVRVSFRINARVWPSQAMVTPLGQSGKPFAPGTVVYATVEGEPRETVVDHQGQVWLAELMPAAEFAIKQDGQRCEFTMPSSENLDHTDKPGNPLIVQPLHCKDAS